MNTRASLFLMLFAVITTSVVYISVSDLRHVWSTGRSGKGTQTSSERTKCIVYDKPPRTGSTTIGRALYSCLKKAGYVQHPPPEGSRAKQKATAIQQMLNFDNQSKRKASLSRHVYITETDLKLIRLRCDDFLYITSTAPIRERLWSAVKHLLARRYGSSINSSLDMKEARQLLRNQSFEKGQLRSLYELNAYPYLTQDAVKVNIKRKLIPDYVIRKASLEHDLKALLHSFRCDDSFKVRNVHKDNIQYLSKLFSDVPLQDEDQLYKSLCETAKQNNINTLKLAATFVPRYA